MQKVTGFIQKSLLGAVVAVLVCFGNAYAPTINPGVTLNSCTTASSSATSNWISVMQHNTATGESTSLCLSYTTKYYKCGTAYYKVQDCNSCASGSTRTLTTFAVGYSNTYYICSVSSLDACLPSSCGTDTAYNPWTSVKTGYQRRINRVCKTVNGTCQWADGTTYSHRCAAGYYGTSPSCTGTTSCSGCSRCLPQDGTYGTSAAGSDASTDCYISSSSSLTNTSGTYKFTSNCYYTK